MPDSTELDHAESNSSKFTSHTEFNANINIAADSSQLDPTEPSDASGVNSAGNEARVDANPNEPDENEPAYDSAPIRAYSDPN